MNLNHRFSRPISILKVATNIQDGFCARLWRVLRLLESHRFWLWRPTECSSINEETRCQNRFLSTMFSPRISFLVLRKWMAPDRMATGPTPSECGLLSMIPIAIRILTKRIWKKQTTNWSFSEKSHDRFSPTWTITSLLAKTKSNFQKWQTSIKWCASPSFSSWPNSKTSWTTS